MAALYEINRLSNRSEFDALGARAEWMHLFSPDLALRIEGDFKDMRHARYSEADTRQSAGYATLFKVFPEGWMLFGGLDVVDRLSEERYMNSYLQHGIRLGASTPSWGGIRATLFSSWRERLYNRYNPLFDKRRSDGEQNHTLILQAPRFSVLGLTPSVVLRHSRVKSNVDWLYSYDKNSISLKLEYQFN